MIVEEATTSARVAVEDHLMTAALLMTALATRHLNQLKHQVSQAHSRMSRQYFAHT